MSLFEKIKNKRYGLQEENKKKKFSSSSSSGNNNSDKNISTSRRNIKKAISDLEATQPGGETPKIETGRTTYNKNKKLDQDLNQRRTAQDRQQQLYNRQYDIDGGYGDSGGSEDGLRKGSSQTSTKTKTKTKTKMDLSKPIKDPWFTDKNDYPNSTSSNKDVVKQSKVSDDASEFTKRVNRANKNRKEFIKGRKAYTDSKTGIGPGKPTKEGIKKYISKARNMSQGTNANTKANKKAAEVISQSASKEYADKITKKYETNKRMIQSRKPRKTVAQLKKEIDSRPVDKRTIKKTLKPKVKPSTTGLYDPFKNKIPDITKIKPLRVPKLAPSALKTTAKTGTQFQRMMKHLGKNRNPYLKTAAGLALLTVGTYGALKNRKASKNRMIPPIGGSKPKEIYKPVTPKLYLQGDDK